MIKFEIKNITEDTDSYCYLLFVEFYFNPVTEVVKSEDGEEQKIPKYISSETQQMKLPLNMTDESIIDYLNKYYLSKYEPRNMLAEQREKVINLKGYRG